MSPIDELAMNEHGAVRALLEEAGLPVPGPDDQPVRMLVACNETGEIVGCIGWERYGELAMLRSLAVRQPSRGRGLGQDLVRTLCRRLAAAGVRDLFLLTVDAGVFFARLGFAALGRDLVPHELLRSRLFAEDHCAAAIVMRQRIA